MRSSGAAQLDGWLERIVEIDGGHHFQVGGTGKVSLTSISGVVTQTRLPSSPGVPMSPTPPLYGCITVDTAFTHDEGCSDALGPSVVQFDPAMTKVRLLFSVPSRIYGGERLSADVTISGLTHPATHLQLPDGALNPANPSVQYTGPLAGYIRFGTVNGQIFSTRAGGGNLIAYTGPTTPQSMAFMSDDLVHASYVNAKLP